VCVRLAVKNAYSAPLSVEPAGSLRCESVDRSFWWIHNLSSCPSAS